MNAWHLRDFAPEDLENAVRLDERSSTTDEPPIFALAEVVKALADRQPAVVPITDGHMVGSAVGRIDGDTMGSAFLNSGFALRRGVSFYEKAGQVTPRSAAVLNGLGGSVPPAGRVSRSDPRIGDPPPQASSSPDAFQEYGR